MANYFDSPAIGSSILAAFIEHPDIAAKEVEPTGFMEMGNIYELLVEEEVAGTGDFSGKYFKSDVDLKPDSAAWKKLLPIFESGQPTREEIDALYTWTKPDKDGNKRLHKTHKSLHRALDQIKAHDYRRLIPEGDSNKLFFMLENFKLAQIDGVNFFDFTQFCDTRFQVEHFWEHESGAECRAKFDMVMTWENDGQKFGMCPDLKVTSNWPQFLKNWNQKYIWQSKHYMEGFRNYCQQNGIIPPDKMWYLPQESYYPYHVRPRALSKFWLAELDEKYNQSIADCWAWIKAGKPVIGHREQETVDIYGRKTEDV